MSLNNHVQGLFQGWNVQTSFHSMSPQHVVLSAISFYLMCQPDTLLRKR